MKLCLLILFVISSGAMAQQTISLSLQKQVDGGHAFYHELLYESLTQNGYQVEISSPSKHIPQKRAIKMVESGALSLTWLLSTNERNERFVPIDIPLTNGLIGKRILLIPPRLQTRFNAINTLDELKQSGLVAGLGVNWFDVDVWRTNQLPVYLEDGEWRSLYWRLDSEGEVNYFPRGLNEILAEAELNPHLSIEKHLMMEYERDFFFYLSPQYAHYQHPIQESLRKAQQSGLLESLVTKHWGRTFDVVKPEDRVVIKLSLPTSPSQKN